MDGRSGDRCEAGGTGKGGKDGRTRQARCGCSGRSGTGCCSKGGLRNCRRWRKDCYRSYFRRRPFVPPFSPASFPSPLLQLSFSNSCRCNPTGTRIFFPESYNRLRSSSMADVQNRRSQRVLSLSCPFIPFLALSSSPSPLPPLHELIPLFTNAFLPPIYHSSDSPMVDIISAAVIDFLARLSFLLSPPFPPSPPFHCTLHFLRDHSN